MDVQQILDWLVLDSIQGLGIKRQHQLLQKYKTPAAIFSLSAEILSRLPQSISNQLASIQQQGLSHPYFVEASKVLSLAKENQWHLICLQDALYPKLLKEIPFAPTILYVKGNVSSLHSTQLGVVGARKASQIAINLSYQWSRSLSAQGITITSGLALGVDASSHRGALAADGETIAVLAHGLDTIYPRSHTKLAEEIIETGALVTEFKPGTEVRRNHFPRRNRIISGLSQGVLVVEAAIKSGSLITAQYALEQNREVFSVPGSVHNPMTAGCHHLIKQGAQLVDHVDDIFESFSNFVAYENQAAGNEAVKRNIDKHMYKLLEKIPYDFIHFDQLHDQIDLKVNDLNAGLLVLEAEGLIEVSGASYRRMT